MAEDDWRQYIGRGTVRLLSTMRKGGEMGMILYKKLIRPMHCYPGPHYEPLTEPIEKE